MIQFITRINKTSRYIVKKYEYGANSEVFPIQETNQEKQKTELQNQKLHPVECYACESSNHLIKDCNKKYTIFVSYRQEKTLNGNEINNGGEWGSKNHTYVKKVGHTSEFLSGIY